MKKYIYGMSFPRKHALAKMEELSEQLNEHVIKCVVYNEMRYMTINHWVDELSTWMNRANKIKCRSKLKQKDYVGALFGAFGNSILDAEINLDSYCRLNRRKILVNDYEAYPDFDSEDSELISKLFNAYQKVIRYSLPYLMSDIILTTQEWSNILLSIFRD